MAPASLNYSQMLVMDLPNSMPILCLSNQEAQQPAFDSWAAAHADIKQVVSAFKRVKTVSLVCDLCFASLTLEASNGMLPTATTWHAWLHECVCTCVCVGDGKLDRN